MAGILEINIQNTGSETFSVFKKFFQLIVFVFSSDVLVTSPQ